ncbi:RNA-binding S4 domain-containing protein [Dialister sp.]|uniref:RNA-binding S4 domain-containing protein n=1 Tax=Dialister sp. TaxID=1955814 RepID=UPI002E822786|nr:RNA-binding S4 domain-containing protein [Dialister sp.]MEE3453498.1 RNA-binding S4 domain-containing protein [Dialister sp.]
MKIIKIYGDYIQLDQFLKKTDHISSGGETGAYLEAHKITLNGIKVHEKRKKIRQGDTLVIDDETFRITGE